jgi:hypothetical protein
MRYEILTGDYESLSGNHKSLTSNHESLADSHESLTVQFFKYIFLVRFERDDFLVNAYIFHRFSYNKSTINIYICLMENSNQLIIPLKGILHNNFAKMRLVVEFSKSDFNNFVRKQRLIAGM